MEELKISSRQIATMAFDRLREENRKDSALRLVRCLLQGTNISLGIGDIDRGINTAIRQCGREPGIGYRYITHFHFGRKTEMIREGYDEIMKELYG